MKLYQTSLSSIALCVSLLAGCKEEGTQPAANPTQTPVASAESTAQAAMVPSAAPSALPSGSPAAAAEVIPEPVAIPVSADIQALVDAADRLPEDKALDQGRQPGQLLSFFDIKPGMRVAELGAGGGYTSEFLARAVGPSGKVYGQNPKLILERFAEKPWSARLKRPVMSNVVRLDREFDSPFPADVKNLDSVFIVLFYHDLYHLGADRAAMDKAVFAALKPGGEFCVIDHAARPGDGAKEVKSLHRIEKSEVVKDVEAAGFKLEKEGQFLRNPRDTKDWSTSPSVAGEKRGTSDRFVLLFRKPN